MPIYRLPKIIAREAAGTQAFMFSKCRPSKIASSAFYIWVFDSFYQSQRPQFIPGVCFFLLFPTFFSISFLFFELYLFKEPRPYQIPSFITSLDIGYIIKISSNVSPYKRPETRLQRRNGRRLLPRKQRLALYDQV